MSCANYQKFVVNSINRTPESTYARGTTYLHNFVGGCKWVRLLSFTTINSLYSFEAGTLVTVEEKDTATSATLIIQVPLLGTYQSPITLAAALKTLLDAESTASGYGYTYTVTYNLLVNTLTFTAGGENFRFLSITAGFPYVQLGIPFTSSPVMAVTYTTNFLDLSPPRSVMLRIKELSVQDYENDSKSGGQFYIPFNTDSLFGTEFHCESMQKVKNRLTGGVKFQSVTYEFSNAETGELLPLKSNWTAVFEIL